MDILYIIMPAYNEAANIRQTIKEWYPVVERHIGLGESRLVVIDDGSKDDTYAILRELAVGRPLLRVLAKPNSGHGQTVLAGYKYALSHHADYIFQTDSDGQTSAADFEKFWKLRKKRDAVIGWRRHREDGCVRILNANALRLLLALRFRIKVKDINTPFRLMNYDMLNEALKRVPQDSRFPNILLTILIARSGRPYTFLPIRFGTRKAGTNSVNLRNIASMGIRAFRELSAIDI